jgi:hypothetical protein
MLDPTSIAEENAMASIRLYPNPTRSNAQVGFFQKNVGSATLVLRNALGSELHREQTGILPVGPCAVSIPSDKLAPGFYLIEILSSDIQLTARLVKE